jgi:hypothetical protein
MPDPTPDAGVQQPLKRLPYPADWDIGAAAAADQRDARARGAAADLAKAAASTILDAGYDPADPAVLMRLGSDHGIAAAADIYGCMCSEHMRNGSLFLAAALALRVAQLEAELAAAAGGGQ